MNKLLIITTIDTTFKYILKDQPKYLNNNYSVTVGSANYFGIKEYAKSKSLNYIHIPMKRKISPLSDIKSMFFLIKALLKYRPDIIHSYTPKAGMVCAISGYLCRIPIRIHTFTGLIFPYKKPFMQFILATIDSLICKLITHIIAEGQGVKKLLLENNITNKAIHIIGNGNIAGVDTKYFNPEKFKHDIRIQNLKKDLNINEGSTTFIFIGRMNQDKGLIELLNAFNNIRNKNISLILVGECESSSFELRVRHLVKKSIININWVDWQEDIRPYLSISSCFILPSYREGFPNVLLQAGAMGLPAIVTDVPGSNEIIVENYNGWICDSKSINELETLITRVSSMSNNELIQMGINARENVNRKYEKSNYQKKLVGYYNQL